MATTLSNSQVINSLNALQRLISSSEKLPVRLSIVAHDNLKTLQNHASNLDEFRRDLLEETAEFDEDGNLESVEGDDGQRKIKFKSDEDRERYIEELNDNYNAERELDLRRVSVDVVDNVEVEPQVVFALDWMFEE